MNLFKKTCISVAVALLPLSAQAAPADLAAEGYEATSDVFTVGSTDYSVFSSAFSATNLATLSAINGSTAIDVSSYSMNLGDGALSGINFLIASSGQNANFGPSPLEIIFTSVSAGGTFAAADGNAVLLSFSDPGLNFGDGTFGTASGFSVTVLNEIAPIPIPPGAVMILSALGGLAVMRRKRA